jgi:hypothetical protein
MYSTNLFSATAAARVDFLLGAKKLRLCLMTAARRIFRAKLPFYASADHHLSSLPLKIRNIHSQPHDLGKQGVRALSTLYPRRAQEPGAGREWLRLRLRVRSRWLNCWSCVCVCMAWCTVERDRQTERGSLRFFSSHGDRYVQRRNLRVFVQGRQGSAGLRGNLPFGQCFWFA